MQGMTRDGAGSKGRGGEFLAKKSDLTKARQALPDLKDFLVVEDEHFDADRLRATLHIMFGYDVKVRQATTLGNALDCVIERLPQVIFLDDYLKPADTASNTIPFLRRCEYKGPIIIISSQVTRKRRAELKSAGAADVIHKDELDSVRIAEALTRVFRAESEDQD